MTFFHRNIVKRAGAILMSAAAAAATSYATTNFLMKAAINRDMPKAAVKAGNLIAGSAKPDRTMSLFQTVLQEKADWLQAQPVQEVRMIARDGVTLIGHWMPAEKPERIVLAMHGWRSSWYKDFGMVAESWRDHNCSVLFVEQRGQNNSGGEYMGFGVTERFDCRDWANYIVEHLDDSLPVYLVGVSMGATTVMMAAGLELPRQVHGILADCGFTSPDAIWNHVASDNLHIAYGLRRVIADNLYERRLQSEADYSTTDALKNSRIPLMLVHGSDDHFVPVSMTYENYKACSAPKRLLIVPGADHGMSFFMNRSAYEKMAEEFWRDFDSVDPPQNSEDTHD